MEILKKIWWGLMWIISLPLQAFIRLGLKMDEILEKYNEGWKTILEFAVLTAINAGIIYLGCLLS